GEVVGLGEDGVLELGVVGAKGVPGGDTHDGGVQLGEEFFGNARRDFGAIAPAHHVFVGNDHTVGFAHGGGDGIPIVGRERAKIEDFDGNAFALEGRGGNFSAANDGAIGDDADLFAFLDQAGFAERNGEIRAGVFGAIVGLAIEMFVLEEHHRIVAANGGAQKTGDIQRGGRHDHAQAGAMRKDGFAALTVINGAAGEIAADGHANDGGAFEGTVGAPTKDAEFIANLHHGGPDVIEELDFRDGLQASGGHADGAAYDAGFRDGRIEDAIGSVFAL